MPTFDLDTQGYSQVGYIELTDGTFVEIEEAFHQTWLSPRQALQLLSWLEQEKETLLQLAEKQRSMV